MSRSEIRDLCFFNGDKKLWTYDSPVLGFSVWAYMLEDCISKAIAARNALLKL